MACRLGMADFVETLLRNPGGQAAEHPRPGVDSRASVLANGPTLLMAAVMGDHIHVVKILLAKGADRYVEDSKGKTAMDYATSLPVRAMLSPEGHVRWSDMGFERKID